jgi:hypothetical protein
MRRFIPAVVAIAAVLSVGSSFADDSVNRTTPTKHQSMKACVEKQKTADVTMSKSEMTRICKDEIKRQKELGEGTPPPRDSAHSP